MADKKVAYDIDGFDVMTNAIISLLNQYPDLDSKITFSSMPEDEGITIYPLGGAIIESEIRDITGWVEHKCIYPFMIIYRESGLSQKNRIAIKEWLDSIGKWLEKQPIEIKGEDVTLTEYPPLTDGRKIESIARTSPSYLYDAKENKVEEWAISINAIYSNKFEKI
jgi:hypothetical protein